MRMQVRWDASDAQRIVREGGSRGLHEYANLILDESRKQVPLDTGALQRSGMVTMDGLTATISYDTPYAVRWHEEQANFQHGRKNKYLEDPCNDPALRARMLDYLRNHIDF